MKSLTSLNLDYTGVTDTGLAHLATLENLSELRMDGGAVTDASVLHLAGLRKLRVLNLYHTLVTEKGLETLKTALPGCHIIWDRDSSLPTRRGS
jgi:hypothetical protein